MRQNADEPINWAARRKFIQLLDMGVVSISLGGMLFVAGMFFVL